MAMHTELVYNYVNGKWEESSGGRLSEQRNPADLSQVTCRFQNSSREDTVRAIDAAEATFPKWSATPVPKRAALLRKVHAEMIRHREEFAKVLTAENGKTLNESFAEIDSAINEMDWQIAEGRRMYGDTVPSERDGVLAFSLRQPLGVVSIISPWNFPFNVPCRKCTPALMAGNTVVFKPASLTPRTGACFVQLFDEAGFPPGVINLITGGGSSVGTEMVSNTKIKAISFTGSTGVGTGIHKQAADTLARTQLEMGGKNPVIVLQDADLDAAADAIVLAAFACAGQWCTSTSRVIVESGVMKPLLDKLLERTKQISVGDGLNPESTMGPVCGEEQLKGILGYIQTGLNEGARAEIGGRQLTVNAMDKGCFIEPTIFSGVTPEMTIAREEIFGPVLSIIEVSNFDQAIRLANDVEFGLSSSIFTSSLSKALNFVEKTEVGLTHVNLPTSVKEPQLSFGGIKQSGVGLPEGGKTGLEFFTEHKVVYINYR